ncbi:multidrug efflux pump, MF Superfamily protein [alpha proteobacterium BAL199]|jgi:MFS transporter, DHA2 family, multidrug resistance protein|nr:multidrug efflux pump, MF Superfamily protein [alpha proteobacterium BAL199]
MCIGMFMAILDIQVVASSLPAIRDALDIPTDDLSWIQTAYLIAEVVAIPLTARLTRPLTIGGLFVVAVTGFVAASVGCAMSDGFASLILFRVLQGFCGGMIIPAVFTAVFVLFPPELRVLPTTIAGVFAMLAPTLGPVVGGYITETFSWHWLFLVNIGPGIVAAVVAGVFIRIGRVDLRLLRRVDLIGLACAAVFLAGLELTLKQGPEQNWQGAWLITLISACGLGALATIWRCLRHSEPLVDLRSFADRPFAAGCTFSFVLGAGLYGSTYLLPLFLGFVRGHSPLVIGGIMVVCGAAQLATAPVAAVAERRIDPRLLTTLGYALFAAGLIGNGFMTADSDFDDLFWPQILRGAAVMFCLLPTTTVALQAYAGDALANASALFNLMRNLGGAVGIAVVDTILAQRTAVHAETLIKQLQAGSREAARLVGLPLDQFTGAPLGPIDDATRAFVAPLVERAALVLSFNEAWLLLGGIFAVSLALVPLLKADADSQLP